MSATPRVKIEVFDSGKMVHQTSFDEFPIVFGRDRDCHLRLEDYNFVSRVHGSISVDRNQIVVTDLGSRHGIQTQGERIDTLREADKINFNIRGLDFVVELQGEEEENSELTAIRVIRDPRETVSQIAHEGVKFSIAPQQNVKDVPINTLCLQGVITWEEDIYDVRNFNVGEPLNIGDNVTEPIYVPTATRQVSFGHFTEDGALIAVPMGTRVRAYRNKQPLSPGTISEEHPGANGARPYLVLRPLAEDVVSIDLNPALTLHFRYVKRPRLKITKTWIENREEIKRAVVSSIAIHALICAIAVIIAPRSKAPKIENVPPRIAKLLVEPPVQIMAPKPTPAPTPVPTAVPTPVPKPPVAEPEPEEIPKQKPKPKPPERKAEPKPKAEPQAASKMETPIAKAPPKSQPPPKPSEQEQLLSALSALPGAPATGLPKAGKPIQINANAAPAVGVKVGGLAAVKNVVSETQPVADTAFNVGGNDAKYSTKGQTGNAGKRGVGGAVMGIPKMSGDISRKQGLSNDQVMAVVNRRLGEIQQCYERALFEDGSLAGRVEYEWEINAGGSVISAKVASGQIAKADTLNNCVLALFNKMKFPAAKNGEPTVAKIGFPFGK